MGEEFKSILKKPINLLFIGVGMILVSVLFMIVSTNQYDTFEKQNKRESYQIAGSMLAFQFVDVDEGNPIYQNLSEQTQIIARQLNSVLFDQPKKYIESSYEMTKLRKELRQEEGFNKDIELLQPTLAKIKMDDAYFSYLLKNDETVYLKPETFSTLSLLFFSILGVLWFPICAFLTANILEDEYEHKSLVKGQPITFLKRCLKKYLALFSLFMLNIGSGLILCLGLTQLFGNSVNDLNNYTVVQLISFSILRNWQVILLNVLYLAVLFSFVFVLSVFLNVLLRNFYLTLIIEMLFYSLTILLPEFISDSPWYLGGYLIPTYLFEGKFLTDSSSALLNPLFGMGYLLVMSGVLLFLISSLSKRGLKGVKA
ncbi:MAG: hypothetical protein RR554_11010 [Vagococcus sp.]|uniref:hypothetical protein n=1 Tax=Vagococcus sp. TaxID=1933889 RepID=UPI002FC69CA7